MYPWKYIPNVIIDEVTSHYNLRLSSHTVWGSVGNVGGDVKRHSAKSSLPRQSLLPISTSISTLLRIDRRWRPGNAVMESCISLDDSRYLPVPSSEIGTEWIFSGGRDMLGHRSHSIHAPFFCWPFSPSPHAGLKKTAFELFYNYFLQYDHLIMSESSVTMKSAWYGILGWVSHIQLV